MTTLDLERFEKAPLCREPFEHLVVPEFVKPEVREAINADYPKVLKPGSFPLSEVTFGPKFKELIDDLDSPEVRAAFGRKFSVDLAGRPDALSATRDTGRVRPAARLVRACWDASGRAGRPDQRRAIRTDTTHRR